MSKVTSIDGKRPKLQLKPKVITKPMQAKAVKLADGRILHPKPTAATMAKLKARLKLSSTHYVTPSNSTPYLPEELQLNAFLAGNLPEQDLRQGNANVLRLKHVTEGGKVVSYIDSKSGRMISTNKDLSAADMLIVTVDGRAWRYLNKLDLKGMV